MSFIDKYNNFKGKYCISEGTVKSLIPDFQTKFLGDRVYSELTDEEKTNLNQYIKFAMERVEKLVNQITTNKQYQSWIYDILKNKDKNINEDFEVIKDCIKDFELLCKRPDLKPNEKNIQSYKTFQELQNFILTFQNNHKLNKDIFSGVFELVVEDNKYSVYSIKSNQYDQCNLFFGGVDKKYFNTGWCVAKNEGYFHRYIDGHSSIDKTFCYYVWIDKITNKPYALLHFGSTQFKDVSDECVSNFDDPSLFKKLANVVKNKINVGKIINECLKWGSDLFYVFGEQLLQILNANVNEAFVEFLNGRLTYDLPQPDFVYLNDDGTISIDLSEYKYYIGSFRDCVYDMFNDIKITKLSGVCNDDRMDPKIAAFLMSKYTNKGNIINEMFVDTFGKCCKLNDKRHVEILKNYDIGDKHFTYPEMFKMNKVDIDYIDPTVNMIYNPDVTSYIFLNYYSNLTPNEVFCKQYPQCELNSEKNIECLSDGVKCIPLGYFSGECQRKCQCEYQLLKIHFDVFETKLDRGYEKLMIDILQHTKHKKSNNEIAAQTFPSIFTIDEYNGKLNVNGLTLSIVSDFINDAGELMFELNDGKYVINVSSYIGLGSFKNFPKKCLGVWVDDSNDSTRSIKSFVGVPECESFVIVKTKAADFSNIPSCVQHLGLPGCKKLKSLSQISHINYKTLDISSTGVTSLVGISGKCNDLKATFCKLTSLEGLPNNKFKRLQIDKCRYLKSLVGSPTYCDNYDCSRTGIRNLVGISKYIKNLHLDGCVDLTSIEGHPIEVSDIITCRSGTPLLKNKDFIRWRNNRNK